MEDGSITVPVAEEGVMARVSRAMVGDYKLRLGRGPDRVRSDWAGPDTVVCRLWHTLTPPEHGLAALGERDRLRATRLVLSDAAREGLSEALASILDRRVRTVVSGLDVANDLAVEVIVLAPTEPALP